MHEYPKPCWIKKDKTWKERVETQPWRAECVIRGEYKCNDCSDGHSRLVVHHIDESRLSGKLNNDQNNLVLLCSTCHARRHNIANRLGGKNIKELLENSLRLSDGVFYMGMFTDVAKKIGVSRERVRQVAKKIGIGTMRKKLEEQSPKVCANCGKPSKTQKYCSQTCKREFYDKKYYATTICEVCGKEVKYRKSREILKPRFCSKVCQGFFLGKNHQSVNKKIRRSSLLLKMEKPFSNLDVIKEFNVSKITAHNWISEQLALGNIKFSHKKGKGYVYSLT